MTEYEVTSVDDSQAKVNAHMREQEQMGWTLVSGSAAAFPVTESESTRVVRNSWHMRYVMYWRRP